MIRLGRALREGMGARDGSDLGLGTHTVDELGVSKGFRMGLELGLRLQMGLYMLMVWDGDRIRVGYRVGDRWRLGWMEIKIELG